ncbi:MAG: hypothetical protein WC881_10870, partial [Elusimicrobiota bacterium]
MMPLEFDLARLSEEGELSFERSIETPVFQAFLEDLAIIKVPSTLKMTVHRQGERAQFQGTAEGEWEFTCVR